MRREMVNSKALSDEQAVKEAKPQLSPFIFISQEPDINASISRYYHYVHNLDIATALDFSSISQFHSSILVISNEMRIDSDICSFYPFWFTYGLRNQIKVYAFTIGMTDFSCNLVNWEDFLNLSWREKFNSEIDFNKVSYFDNTRGHLTGILKPHGGESLYDLAAGFQMTFANASRYIARIKTSGKGMPANFKPDIIEPGTARFREFLKKQPRHHEFLSMLPEADLLFAAVKELGSLIDDLAGVDFNGIDSLETLLRLLLLIEPQTSFIHSFFLNLETFLQGGPQ